MQQLRMRDQKATAAHSVLVLVISLRRFKLFTINLSTYKDRATNI